VCREIDPEAFFPKPHDPQRNTQIALAACATCPVRPYCLEEGWDQHYGIWGGWTTEARRVGRRRYRNATRTDIRALSITTRTE
jgi:hypothetical protein